MLALGLGIPFALLCLWVGILLARHHTEMSMRLGEGEYAPVTLKISLPKFSTEDEGKQREAHQTTKEKIAVAETLFSALGSMDEKQSFLEWVTGVHEILALEIVAQEKVLRFYATIPKKHRVFFEQQVHAQWSNAYISEVDDFNIFSPKGVSVAGYITQRREAVLPVKTYKDLESDPLSALTNALSSVEDGDGVVVQILLRKAPDSWRSFGQRIVRNMHDGVSFHDAKRGSNKKSQGFFEKTEDYEKRMTRMRDRKLSALETKMLEGIEGKIAKAGLEVNVRVVACAKEASRAQMYVKNVLQTFGQFNIYEYGNAFQASIPSRKTQLLRRCIYRQFSHKERMILNTEELAGLWHLPLATTETPNIEWLMAKTAPVPPNVPTEGLFLGYNMFRGHRTNVFMKPADRRRHMYILGKTGAGKSEFIKTLIAQDIQEGKGVAVIDPHGDLVDGCLEIIPKERIDDVIYFNPADLDRPFGLNMMEYDPAHPEQKTFAVNEMISIFDQLYDLKQTGGPMFEQYMRNSMLLVMDDPESGSTLLEITRVLADADFRKYKLARCTNRVVKDFWEKEAEKAGGDAALENMVPYITSKLNAFISNDYMRPIIIQQKSSFDFRKVLDEGKILLVNLSKGRLGEMNAALLGMILVGRLQISAFGRTDIEESARKDFFLYIDEFQNFITPSIATILSEARKYRLNLIMAHQYMGQLVKNGRTEIRDAVLGNVGSLFVARIGPEDVEILGKIFHPVFSASDLMNTNKFTWNAKMIIDNAQEKPFTMQANPPTRGNPRVAELLREMSRLQYGKSREEIEEEVAQRMNIGKRERSMPSIPKFPSSYRDLFGADDKHEEEEGEISGKADDMAISESEDVFSNAALEDMLIPGDESLNPTSAGSSKKPEDDAEKVG